MKILILDEQASFLVRNYRHREHATVTNEVFYFQMQIA